MPFVTAVEQLNGVVLQPYRKHPRIVELRISALHNVIVSDLGEVYATEFFKHWCDLNKINSTFIIGIINQKPRILRLAVSDRQRYKQELIFMGLLYNENRLDVAYRYLGVSKTHIYDKNQPFDPWKFVTEEWVHELENNVTVCGVPQYLNEALRFLDSLEVFLTVVGHVSMAKTRI